MNKTVLECNGIAAGYVKGLNILQGVDLVVNEKEIEDCIKFASVCGLLTCLGEGAIEQQPYYEKVNKFLGSLIS